MAKLDKEIIRLEDELDKLQAKKSVAQMSAHSGEFLHSNLRLAMQYLDQAPAEAQKALLSALIKEIIAYEDHIEIKMYISDPTHDSLSANLPAIQANNTPINGKRPTNESEALTVKAQGSPERPIWLPPEDSNLRHGG